MDLNELLKSPNYLRKEITHLFSTNIYEYDVRAANINCLISCGKITQDLYDFLVNSDKHFREVYIGNMIKNDRTIYIAIQDVLMKCKSDIISNLTNPDNVLRIANDAVYFMNPLSTLPPEYVVMNNGHPVTFIRKNIFTSYMKFDKLLIFMNTGGNDFVVDVIGIDNAKLALHEPFLSIICEVVQAKEAGDTKTAIRIFNEYYTKFINRELPIEYYREFNSTSQYKILTAYGEFYMDNISDINMISALNIDRNIWVLRNLYSYILM